MASLPKGMAHLWFLREPSNLSAFKGHTWVATQILESLTDLSQISALFPYDVCLLFQRIYLNHCIQAWSWPEDMAGNRRTDGPCPQRVDSAVLQTAWCRGDSAFPIWNFGPSAQNCPHPRRSSQFLFLLFPNRLRLVEMLSERGLTCLTRANNSELSSVPDTGWEATEG